VYAALTLMKRGRVRRLPVLDSDGQLKGLLSLEDIVIRGLDARAVLPEEIVATLRGLYERRPVPASSGERCVA
jgi:signal-transduction protein with cAMP-binding, CBS, and nucleotidyltransferase domain